MRHWKIGTVALIIVALGAAFLVYYRCFNYETPPILQKPIASTRQAPDATSLDRIHHIFIIVEENHDWSTIYNSNEAPYINNTLLPQAAFANNYHNVPQDQPALHPSEPNYIMLEAGNVSFPDHTFSTDNDPSATNSTSSHDHLAYLLDRSGLTWKSYQESMPTGSCPITSSGEYAAKHDPFVFFQDVSGNPPNQQDTYCIANIRPFSELASDLATNNVANYSFITPNIIHDMHSGTLAQADTWLSQVVPTITNSSTFQKDGLLIIVWDEGSIGTTGNPPIGLILVSPFVKKGYSNSISYSSASVLKTAQETFHVSPLLGLAGTPAVNDLSDFLTK